MNLKKKKVVLNEQFFLRIQPELKNRYGLIREAVNVDFTPNLLRNEENDYTVVNVTPQFNKDGLEYTHAFKSDYENLKQERNENHANSKENFEKKRMELAEKRKLDIFEPLPGKRHRTCGICMVSFNDYLEHLREPTHQQKLLTNKTLRKVKEDYMQKISTERDSKIRQLLSKRCGKGEKETPKHLENQFDLLNIFSSQKTSHEEQACEKDFYRVLRSQEKACAVARRSEETPKKEERMRIIEASKTKSAKKRTFQEARSCSGCVEGESVQDASILKMFKNNKSEKIIISKHPNGETVQDSLWGSLKNNFKEFVCDIKQIFLKNPLFSLRTASKN